MGSNAPDWRPPRRLRHVRSFLVRQLTLPDASQLRGCSVLELECFLALHCLPPTLSPLPAPQLGRPAHVSERVRGILCPPLLPGLGLLRCG